MPFGPSPAQQANIDRFDIMDISGGRGERFRRSRLVRVLSGTELLVVILAGAALIAMGVSAVVGIITRLRRGVVNRSVRTALWLRGSTPTRSRRDRP